MTHSEGRIRVPDHDSDSFHDLLAARSRQYEAVRRQASSPIAARIARFRALDPRSRRSLIGSAAATSLALGVLGLGLALLWRGEPPLGRPAVVSASGLAILIGHLLAKRLARWKSSWSPGVSRA